MGMRGGWKIEQEWSTGCRFASWCRHANDPGPARVTGMAGMAHWPEPGGGAGGIVEKGGAGLPEQSAPEHGVGRSWGVSP